MGQQQLLLLVLATVIVGIAIAVGIMAFRENSVRSNYDALIQDAIRIGNDAQAWKQKPQMFGGQDDVEKTNLLNFAGVSLTGLGYSIEAGGSLTSQCYRNRNGWYEVESQGGTGLHIRGASVPYENYVQVEVLGILDTDIALNSTVSVIGGKNTSGADVTVSTLMSSCVLPTVQSN